MAKVATIIDAYAVTVDVSIIMPCLNEAQCLPHCIANAREALDQMRVMMGLSGEIIISDNGSDDGSQMISRALGATVLNCEKRGYGAALIYGMRSANGRYLIMGDADGSYDFRDAVAMVEKLVNGADLCMGSRFKAGIAPGAMPWKNRYIGNPVLTGILNLFFRAGVDDAHCGLRALTRDCFERLDLKGSGMEFASEMVIKAALKKQIIAETPAKLLPDLRHRPPHLRPWRDGWRHLRYLLMLSPSWLFGLPALLGIAGATLIFGVAALHDFGLLGPGIPFGASWTIVAGFLFVAGHFALLMALATHFYGVRQGYKPLRPSLRRIRHALTLESALLAGAALMTAALAGFVAIGVKWSWQGFAAPPSVLPVTLSAVLGTVGMQTSLGGFLLAIIADHDARLAPQPDASSSERLM
jgi:glycosyltransferase involved in cell wall biosynthesis